MKKTFALILIFISLQALSQTSLPRDVWKTIPNGTKILTVETTGTKAGNFQQAIDLLLDNNFEIEKYDETLGTITTAPKPLPRTGVYYLNIRTKPGKIILSGLFNTNVSIDFGAVRSEAEYWDIEKRGGRNSAFGQAFYQMHQVANSFGKVSF